MLPGGGTGSMAPPLLAVVANELYAADCLAMKGIWESGDRTFQESESEDWYCDPKLSGKKTDQEEKTTLQNTSLLSYDNADCLAMKVKNVWVNIGRLPESANSMR
ncbi:hypothetical protein CTI12_AA519000 [Artemisia annua]|uniref:Uncharacterized protein n=1 Tax=Artemisia annua TaxID=35608 RepID=A0A2U1L7X0_ARTAN|nr:hypothetical protein CTI12_AA519000 [Artemisia annua]